MRRERYPVLDWFRTKGLFSIVFMKAGLSKAAFFLSVYLSVCLIVLYTPPKCHPICSRSSWVICRRPRRSKLHSQENISLGQNFCNFAQSFMSAHLRIPLGLRNNILYYHFVIQRRLRSAHGIQNLTLWYIHFWWSNSFLTYQIILAKNFFIF